MDCGFPYNHLSVLGFEKLNKYVPPPPKLFDSMGALHYSRIGQVFKLTVEVDPQLVAYARALVPKDVALNQQRYAPHVSVIRKEVPPWVGVWGAYEGLPIQFQYNPIVRNDEMYYWLEVFAPRLAAIRMELGLPASRAWTRPPDGADCFHCTIGNTKNIKP